MGWVVQGDPEVYQTEGEALAAAWARTPPGGKRPDVILHVAADDSWKPVGYMSNGGIIKPLDVEGVRVSAWKIGSDGGWTGSPAWKHEDEWPLKIGEKVQMSVSIPVAQSMVDDENPSVIDYLRRSLTGAAVASGKAHDVYVDVESVNGEFVIRARKGPLYRIWCEGRRVANPPLRKAGPYSMISED